MENRRLRWGLLKATAAIVGFSLAACGGSEPEPTSPTPASTPPPAASPEAQSPEASDEPTPAPPLEFTSLDGRRISLAELRGRPVVVFFFSTDCPHCQRAAEELAPIYAEWKERGLEILGLALNPTAEQNLGEFVAEHDVEFPVATADRQTFARFAGLSMMTRFYYPYLIFVSPEGLKVEAHQGSDRAFFANFERSMREALRRLTAN